MYAKQEPLTVYIRDRASTHTETVYKKTSLEAFLQIFSAIAKKTISPKNIYVKKKAEVVCLAKLLASQPLEDLLVDRAEFEIAEVVEEGLTTVNIKFKEKVVSMKADKGTTIEELLSFAEAEFAICMQHYVFKGDVRDFYYLDRKELLSTYYDDLVVEFEVQSFAEPAKVIKIIKINSEYDKNKNTEEIVLKTEG